MWFLGIKKKLSNREKSIENLIPGNYDVRDQSLAIKAR